MRQNLSQLHAIVMREFTAYFATALAYIFIIVFLLSLNIATFFLGSYFEAGQADLRSFFAFHPWVYLFFLPAISMRLWAEERRNGSIELLLTLPVPLWVVVVGKFFAAWGFAILALSLNFPIWLTVNYLGSPDNGVILAGFLGSALMAGGYIAIGSAMSALTRNQVTAFSLSVVVSFFFTISGLPFIAELFDNILAQNIIDSLVNFSMLTHFDMIANGVLDARGLIFFASLIFVFLSATMIIIEVKKADSGGGRA